MKNQLMATEHQLIAMDNVLSFCSIPMDTPAEKAAVYNMISNPTNRLSSLINTTIMVKDVFFEPATFTDSETGEVSTGSRIVLIDDLGNSYACASKGVYNSLRRLVAMFGLPTWEPALPVKVRQIEQKNLITFVLELDTAIL